MAQNETIFRSFLRALDELGRLAVGETDLRKLATTATSVIKNCLDLPYVAMVRVDQERGLLEYLADAADVTPAVKPGDTQPITAGIVGLCAREQQPVFIEDVTQDPDYVEITPGTRAELAVPIMSRGKAVGVLNCEATDPLVLEEAQMFLEVAANRLGVAVENAVLLHERDSALALTIRDARRLELLNNISRIAAESLDMRGMLQRVVEAIARGFEWEFVACAIVDREHNEFECQAVYSRVPSDVYPGYRRALGSGVVGEVAATGRAIHVPDARKHANFIETLAGTMSELCVPVFDVEGNVIAALNLESIRPNAFDGQLTIMQTIARQVAGAIANAKLYAESRRREDHLQGLSELSRVVLEEPELEAIIQRVVRFVYEKMSFPVVGVVMVNPGRETYRLVAHAGSIPVAFDTGTFPMGQGIVGRCLREGQTQFVPDVRADQDLVPVSGEIVAELCLPITYRGEVLGALNVESTSAEDFPSDTRLVLQAFVDQVAGAIANAELYAETRRRSDQLHGLSELSRVVLDEPGLEAVIQRVVRFVYEKMGFPVVGFVMLNAGGENYRVVAHSGSLPFELATDTFPVNRGIVGRCLRQGATQFVPDVRKDPDLVSVNDKIIAELAIPIVYRGEVLGALNVESTSADDFPPDIQLVLQAFVDQMAGAVNLAKVNARLGDANNSLTELFGRYVAPNLAEKLLHDPDSLHTSGERREVSVMFADIRGFTSISQRMETPRVFELLNEFFPRMTEAVFQHRGSINRFLGDGFMAVFGAPEALKDHARAAIDACFELQHRVGEFGRRWQQLTGELLRVVTVVNSGEVIYGSVGDPRHREFTVLGDVVNVASRLETEAKTRNARILVTGDVYRAAGEKAPASSDTVLLRGREGEVRVYQLL